MFDHMMYFNEVEVYREICRGLIVKCDAKGCDNGSVKLFRTIVPCEECRGTGRKTHDAMKGYPGRRCNPLIFDQHLNHNWYTVVEEPDVAPWSNQKKPIFMVGPEAPLPKNRIIKSVEEDNYASVLKGDILALDLKDDRVILFDKYGELLSWSTDLSEDIGQALGVLDTWVDEEWLKEGTHR